MDNKIYKDFEDFKKNNNDVFFHAHLEKEKMSIDCWHGSFAMMDISNATQKGKKCVQYTIQKHAIQDFNGVYISNEFFDKGITPADLLDQFNALNFEIGKWGGYKEYQNVFGGFTLYKSEVKAVDVPSPFVKREVKFMKKGIKVNGNYYPVWYSKGREYAPESGIESGTITIYARDYKSIPNFGVEVENNSDSMTDYFETDKIRISPDSPFYQEVLKVA